MAVSAAYRSFMQCTKQFDAPSPMGYIASMKSTWLILGAVLLVLMASYSNSKEPCPCSFTMKVRNALAKQLTLSRYRIHGLSERDSRRFIKQAELRPGMPLEISNDWFTKHAPCGGKKFCVEGLEFERDTNPNASGNTTLTILMRARP
jgi:hypothetical protein